MAAFEANVQSCRKTGYFYEVVLDRTAFFPEGGGQYADTGVIDGVRVVDVQEKDGVIYHKVCRELEIGKAVTGTINWQERFVKMQHHSGEHIVSGLVHSTFGYSNVGFHMGKDAVTMDFNGVLSKEQLREIEQKANEAVVQNLDIEVLYPSREELPAIEYRSKIEIEGQVRLVRIPGYDTCACCAPHVKKTGEIGLIKLTNMQNYKGGVRISMLCGFDALRDYTEKSDSVRNISMLLSAKENEVYEEVLRLKEELTSKKNQISELQRQLLSAKVASLPMDEELLVLFEVKLDGNGPRELVNLLLEKGSMVGAVFAGNDADGYRYVIGSRQMDTRGFAKRLNEKFQGRGGGKPEMVQGSLYGEEESIRKEVEMCRKELLDRCSGDI